MIAGGIAVSLHAGAFYGAFYHSQDSGSLAVGEQGIEFDLGMMGDMGVAEETIVAQAEVTPPPPEPEPEPIKEPEIEPDLEVEPEPEIEPPVEEVEVKQTSEVVAPKPKPEPKPKPKPEPEPEPEPQPEPEPEPTPKSKPTPQPQVVEQANAAKTVVQQKASTGSANAATSGGAAGATANYYAKLAAKLAQSKRYPRASRRRGEEGIVTIGFTVHANGDASQVRIVKSSGSKRLDGAAMDMVKRAQPLPAFSLDMGDKPLDITLPVAFELR